MDAWPRCYPRWLIFSVLLALASTSSRAQTPSPLPEWYYSEGHLLERYTRDDLPRWERTIGIATETQPKYEGSNAYEASGGPVFDIRYRDIAFASSGEGFGINLLRGKRYRAGVATSFDMGRDARDDHHLTGLGNIGISPEAKLFAEYMVVFPLVLRVDARHSFGGQGGWIGDVSLYSPLAGSEKFFVFAGPSLSFADSNNMRHTFGVSDTQSVASGYAPHDAGRGLRSGSFGVSAGYFFNSHWLVEGAVATEKLFGGAGDSPFVQERGQVAATVSTEYRW
jgi:outer membrane scaffolding protein for murein synthesis (MipA/OmpV family)